MGVKVVRKSGRNDYYVQICIGGQRWLRHGGTRNEANEKKREIKEAIKNGTFVRPDREPEPERKKEPGITFKKYAEKWLSGTVANNLKWNTKRYYADMLKRIPDSIQDRPFDEITRDDVRNLVFSVIDKGLARTTAAGIIRTVSTIYTYAAEDGVYRGANIAMNPSRILRQDNGAEPADDDQIDRLDKKESDHLLAVAEKNTINPSFHPLLLSAVRLAARQGELVGLTWDAIDWDGGFVTIRQTIVNNKAQSTKSRQKRKIPMSPYLREVLKKHHKVLSRKAAAANKPMSPLVFPNPKDGFLDPSKLRKEFTAVLELAELRKVEFRSLRNTALTIMAESGVPITALQRIAGHSSIEITARFYLKVKPELHEVTLNALSAMDTVNHANGNANSGVVEAVCNA